MKTTLYIFLTFYILLNMISCTHFILLGSYEITPISIHFINFFNQQAVSTHSQHNWYGDWIFRRKRLAIIDNEINIQKPDILIMQEILSKEGSMSESDINILKFSSLQFYNIDTALITKHKNTYEEEYIGIAIKSNYTIIPQEKNNTWILDNNNFAAFFIIQINKTPVLIVQIKLQENQKHYLNLISQSIDNYLKEFNICKYRIIVAGEFYLQYYDPELIKFLQKHKLHDTDKSFCIPYFKCATLVESNDIFKHINIKFNTMKPDKIFVHNRATILASGLSFTTFQTIKEDDYVNTQYGIKTLFPSYKYGWSTKIFLPKCIAKN